MIPPQTRKARRRNFFTKTFFIDLQSALKYTHFKLTHLSEKEGRSMAAPKKALTKSQIVAHFAEKFDLSKKSAATILERQRRLPLPRRKRPGFYPPGIGKLVISNRKARMGFNPQQANRSRSRKTSSEDASCEILQRGSDSPKKVVSCSE